MSYRLLVLDIDGTLANSEKEVSENIKKAVLGLLEKEVQIVLASGRPPEGVLPIAKELGFDRFNSYVLAFNGSKIIHFKTGKCVFEKTLPEHIPERLWNDAKQLGVGIAAYTPGKIIAGTKPDCYMELESRITGMPIEYRENFAKDTRLLINECLITGNPEELEAVEPVFMRKYFHETQVFHSEPWYLEVIPKNMNKAYGLKYLLKQLELKREEVICCGDSDNDRAMIEYAGLGVAMANASEKIKTIADYITSQDNDHDGVLEVIERFF